MFETNYESILHKIDEIDLIEYGTTRNYIDGKVTKLSPYISRGVISTRQIAEVVLRKGYPVKQIDSFLKELAWRDYFQQVWLALDNLEKPIKEHQQKVAHHSIPTAILSGTTGIEGIDRGIAELKETGWMHNHLRMYVASITCNIAKSNWLNPARWLYYHLLDADYASNFCSWQWVAGAFSNKKYYANQENINKYCRTTQQHTFLDVPYADFEDISIPDKLLETDNPVFETELPNQSPIEIDESLPTYVYNLYNVDPIWMNDIVANRVLMLEPNHFKQYPVCDKTLAFAIALSKNILSMQVFIGNFDEFKRLYPSTIIHYKEHPTAKHYEGIQHSRDWMFPKITGYFPSFFAYWRKCEPFLADYLHA